MDLPYRGTRDEAYDHAMFIAEQVGYAVSKVGENQLGLWGEEDHLLITYDTERGHMVNVEPVKVNQEAPPRPSLLDDKSREALPMLYSQEKEGLQALVQVKF